MAEPTTEPKRLYRSRTDKQVSGVCGGLAKYFNLDASLIRIALVVFVICTGIFPGVIGYIIAAAVIPYEPETKPEIKEVK